MKKIKTKIVFRVVLDLLLTWSILIVGLYYGVLGVCYGYTANIILVICEIPILHTYIPHTIRWISIAIACTFFKPKTILTKGFRFAMKESTELYNSKSKWSYSIVFFDDSKLKGRYVYLSRDVDGFKNGKPLEIVYYPRSKYILSMNHKEL